MSDIVSFIMADGELWMFGPSTVETWSNMTREEWVAYRKSPRGKLAARAARMVSHRRRL